MTTPNLSPADRQRISRALREWQPRRCLDLLEPRPSDRQWWRITARIPMEPLPPEMGEEAA